MGEGPFGLIDLDLDREVGDKIQLGVSGTSFPNRPKSPLNILYVLDSHVASLPGDVRSSTLRDKIQDKFRGDPTVKAQRSGRTSAKPFDQQAIVVALRGDNLPVQDPQIHNAADTIERHYSDFGVGVQAIVMDTE